VETHPALRGTPIALSRRILSNVGAVALLVDVGVANPLGLFASARVAGLNALFPLSLRLESFRLLSIFVANIRNTGAADIGGFLQ
jgi:hypothetical protein